MQRSISFSLNKNSVLNWVKKGREDCSNSDSGIVNVVDLFCGCGGLSLGLKKGIEEKGFHFEVCLAIDNSKSALEVYKDNNSAYKDNALCVDILDVFSVGEDSKKLNTSERKLKKRIGALDFLVAGPPCQGHSDLNNSTRRNDPRNRLYLSCIRAVQVLNPNVVIIENVPTVIHSKEGVVQKTNTILKKLGYYVYEFNVNFLDLGIPQRRNRHVLLASKSATLFNVLHPPSNEKHAVATLKEFIFDIKETKNNSSLMYRTGKPSEENIKRMSYLFENNLFNLPDTLRPPCHRNKAHSYKSVYGRLDWDNPAQTLTSGYGSMGQGRYLHPSERRTINSKEAARIQGLPDYYDFSSVKSVTDLRVMIANAVPPQLTYFLSKLYLDFSKNELKEKPISRFMSIG